jgi:hypothetical protein
MVITSREDPLHSVHHEVELFWKQNGTEDDRGRPRQHIVRQQALPLAAQAVRRTSRPIGLLSILHLQHQRFVREKQLAEQVLAGILRRGRRLGIDQRP